MLRAIEHGVFVIPKKSGKRSADAMNESLTEAEEPEAKVSTSYLL